mmetsp:Transcript_13867/g.20164  ORF Transcript_13867/g.20164 Transcript_13867/m.20164 type:complete len:1074 (-) Transcript_13867:53-3274(-)
MSEYGSYSGGCSTSNVFERLAVSETHSSARKRNTSRKPSGHGYVGGASSVSSTSFSVSRSRPSTPASLYETPSFNSSSSSRKVNPAIFDRLATTETYATATMKGKVDPERGRSKSTSKRTSNAFFDRMAYTETFASAQMKGLIDTDDGTSKASNGNGRPVSRGRSVKSSRSIKSTRSMRSTSRSQGGESFFDRMANTDTYASAQLKGKYTFEKTASPRHTPASRYKPPPRSTPKSRMSIFDRLSSTQTLSSAGKNRKTPDSARSYRSMHSQNYPQSGSSHRKSSTRSYGSSYSPHHKYSPTASVGSTRSNFTPRSQKPSYSPHHKYSSTASVGSARSNFTSRSQRSAASARSAYTAPSTRTARTAASTARSSSSSRGMSSSFSSSYRSHSNTTDYVKPVARYAKPAPVAQVPIHSRNIPVLATSPTPEKLHARRPPTPESSFVKRPSSNASSRRSVRKSAVNPPSPMSASMSKSFTRTLKTESKPARRGLSSVSQPITATIPKRAPEIEPKPPSPPPRPVLQFESDDELSFGDDSEEDDDFLAAPSSVSSVKAAPQDARSTIISETKEGNNIRTEDPEDLIPENNFNEVASKIEEEPITITKDRGFDSREEFTLDPESEEEGVVEAITSDVLDESDEDGSYHMDDEEPESENEKSENSEEKMQQDDEPIVAVTSTQEAAEESDDGLSIGSGESEDDDWLNGTGTATKSEDTSEPVEHSHSALEEEEDELGDLLDSEAESAELSAEEAPSRADSVESIDSIEISEQVTDDAQDVDTFDDVEDDEEVDADPDDFPDDLDEEEAEDQDYYNEEIEQFDSLDLVLDATGDEYDVSVDGDEDEILEEIGENSEENDDEEEYVAESMEDEDYLSEDGVSVGDEDELDDFLEEANIKPEESKEEEDYVAESMDDEEYMSEGEDDEIDIDPAEEMRDMVEEEPTEEVLDLPTYTIVKSEKYHPQIGFEPVNPDDIFLTGTLLAFESGEISNQEIAVLLIEALFEKDFENGGHWEVDAGTARELEEDEGGGGDMEGRSFVVKRQARLDWNDLYSVAAAKGNIIISPEKKEIRVENYSYFVAG